MEASCSFKSLDHLKSGGNRDAQVTPDSRFPSDALSVPTGGEDGAGGISGTPDAGGDVFVSQTGGLGQDANGGMGGLVSTGGSRDAGGAVNTAGTVGPGSTGGVGGMGGTPSTSVAGGRGGTAGAVQTGGSGKAGSIASTSVVGGRGGTSAAGQTAGSNTSSATTGGTGGTLTPDAGPDAYVPPDVAKTRTALLVVGSTNLNTGDAAIKSHLVGRGIAVTAVSDDNVPSNVTQNIVLITRTILSANIGTKLRASTKPVMVWEPELYDDMGMIDGSSSSRGNSSSYTTLDLSSSAGALAAGLSGTVTFANTGVEVSWGVPNANAIKVASLPGASTKWPIFAYDTGAQMPGLTAPARRAGFIFSATSAANMTANGWLLFDTLYDWLAP